MATIVITGISRGIGLGLAQRYLERGDSVFGTVRAANEATERLVAQYRDRLTVVEMDVKDADSATRAAATVGAAVGQFDILICNAAINLAPIGKTIPFADQDDAEFLETFDVNVVGVLRTIRAFYRLLAANSGGARVAIISSGAGSISRQTEPQLVSYRVSKAGLNMLSRLFSFQLAEDGIDVFALTPGSVKTDMGGPLAKITVEESTSRLVRLIDDHELGGVPFQSYEGEPIDW